MFSLKLSGGISVYFNDLLRNISSRITHHNSARKQNFLAQHQNPAEKAENEETGSLIVKIFLAKKSLSARQTEICKLNEK